MAGDLERGDVRAAGEVNAYNGEMRGKTENSAQIVSNHFLYICNNHPSYFVYNSMKEPCLKAGSSVECRHCKAHISGMRHEVLF